MDFVFISVDSGAVKKVIVEYLEASKIPSSMLEWELNSLMVLCAEY